MNLKKTIVMLFATLFIFANTSKAQTQEEIEQMLNGQKTKTEEKVKQEKAPKEAKVKEEKVKAEKVAKEKETKAVKTEKVAKEIKEKEAKAVKTEKVTKGKVETVKAEKVAKPAAESAAKEKTTTASASDEDKPYKTWSLSIFGGLTNPVTDIRYKDWFGALDPINENQWNAGLKVTKMFDGAFGLQWQGSYNVVQGAFDNNVKYQEDRDYLVGAGLDRGVYFKSNVVASSMNIYWNISNTVFGANRYLKAKLENRSIKPRRFSLYMTAGIGGTWFDPHVMFIDDKSPASFPGVSFVNNNIDRTIFEMNIPIGIGTKFKLGKSVDLGFEYVLNYVFTDKLDAFVYDHPNRVKNDLYTNLNMTLDFKLGTKNKSKEHIEWVSPMNKVYDELAKIDAMDKKLKKLTKDSDDDGVSDWFDKDNETEEGIVVDGSGKALDSDADGIPDRADLEPFTDKGAKVDEFGIALDDDNDGVPNHKDLEPNSPKDSFVNFQGVAIDGKVKPAETRGFSFPSIFFDTDQATIKRDYEDELFMIAKDILRMENTNFVLSGNCDERGSEEYNNDLGLRRAEAVKAYLIENYGIDGSRLQVVSKGKSEINSPRFNINRRVDVLLIEK